jgi:hypothetical protein
MIIFFQFFTFSSSQAADNILNPPHNQYNTASTYRNLVTFTTYLWITTSAVQGVVRSGLTFSGHTSMALVTEFMMSRLAQVRAYRLFFIEKILLIKFKTEAL